MEGIEKGDVAGLQEKEKELSRELEECRGKREGLEGRLREIIRETAGKRRHEGDVSGESERIEKIAEEKRNNLGRVLERIREEGKRQKEYEREIIEIEEKSREVKDI